MEHGWERCFVGNAGGGVTEGRQGAAGGNGRKLGGCKKVAMWSKGSRRGGRGLGWKDIRKKRDLRRTTFCEKKTRKTLNVEGEKGCGILRGGGGQPTGRARERRRGKVTVGNTTDKVGIWQGRWREGRKRGENHGKRRAKEEVPREFWGQQHKRG